MGLEAGQQIGLDLVLPSPVLTLALGSFQGRPIAVTSNYDKTVRMWDLEAGQQIGPELAVPLPVRAVAMGPGERLVIGFGRGIAVLAPR